MKIIVLLSLLLAFSSCTSARTSPNPWLPVVRDTKGAPLEKGARYFIVSLIRGAGGGGVKRGFLNEQEASKGNFVCPFQVTQAQSDLDRGMPVFFKPKSSKQALITESSPLNIKFYVKDPSATCNQNLVWMVEGFPGIINGTYFLSTNGVEGDALERDSWFQIKKFDDDISFSYKLVFCPWEEVACFDVGVEVGDGHRRLGLNANRVFPVMFIKDEHYMGDHLSII